VALARATTIRPRYRFVIMIRSRFQLGRLLVERGRVQAVERRLALDTSLPKRDTRPPKGIKQCWTFRISCSATADGLIRLRSAACRRFLVGIQRSRHARLPPLPYVSIISERVGGWTVLLIFGDVPTSDSSQHEAYRSIDVAAPHLGPP
jgi:hypothetical protein